jgi:hypothetical protein
MASKPQRPRANAGGGSPANLPAQPTSVGHFTPVPVRARHDGWTVEKQYAFIEALAQSSCVDEACRRVGMSDTSAYDLRMRPGGAPFRRAWEAALDYSLHFVEQGVFNRSRHGVPRPIFYKGEKVGEWRHYDERLTMFLLRTRRPDRYGKAIERTPPVAVGDETEEAPRRTDPGIELDGGLEEIAWNARDYVPEDEQPDEGSGA